MFGVMPRGFEILCLHTFFAPQNSNGISTNIPRKKIDNNKEQTKTTANTTGGRIRKND